MSQYTDDQIFKQKIKSGSSKKDPAYIMATHLATDISDCSQVLICAITTLFINLWYIINPNLS